MTLNVAKRTNAIMRECNQWDSKDKEKPRQMQSDTETEMHC